MSGLKGKLVQRGLSALRMLPGVECGRELCNETRSWTGPLKLVMVFTVCAIKGRDKDVTNRRYGESWGSGMALPACLLRRGRTAEVEKCADIMLDCDSRRARVVQHQAAALVRFSFSRLRRRGVGFFCPQKAFSVSILTGPTFPRFVLKPGKRMRIDALMGSEWDAALLYRMLLPRESAGLGGSLYVCGQAGFTKSIMSALKALIARFHIKIPGSLDPHPEAVSFLLFGRRGQCFYARTCQVGLELGMQSQVLAILPGMSYTRPFLAVGRLREEQRAVSVYGVGVSRRMIVMMCQRQHWISGTRCRGTTFLVNLPPSAFLQMQSLSSMSKIFSHYPPPTSS